MEFAKIVVNVIPVHSPPPIIWLGSTEYLHNFCKGSMKYLLIYLDLGIVTRHDPTTVFWRRGRNIPFISLNFVLKTVILDLLNFDHEKKKKQFFCALHAHVLHVPGEFLLTF